MKEEKKNYQDEDKKSAINKIKWINSQIKKSHLKMIPIKDNYKNSVRTRLWKTVAQQIEVLSLYGYRWALSEDSGFKSYPSLPEVYLVKNVVR